MNESVSNASVKPTIKREHLLTMNAYDAFFLCDWTGKQAKLADLLALPSWEVIRKFGI